MGDAMLEEHAIIDPPKIVPQDIPKRKYKYIIDSRDRNKNTHPDPSKYSITLDEEITDVISVELLLTDFHFNSYNVTKHNNILHTSIRDFEIPEGEYNGETIVFALNEMIHELTITYDSIKHKIIFKNNTGSNITLYFLNEQKTQFTPDIYVDVYKEKSIGKLLGFDIKDYDIMPNNSIHTPFVLDLYQDKYIIMYMDKARNYFSQNTNANQCFAIINKSESPSLGLNVFDQTTIKYFNPPIPSLKRLNFKFKQYDGHYYDFQNIDHRFVLLFTCYKQTRCYNEIFN